ncbi:hypothetical protein K227x_01000 [Rubripirellula lacrimiformis]|uniref:Uncharacterized protein n=1 Tax=Rubripirellula lacrimiformis TaxID=1930273 RepID=A0A517N3M2_9BACT|nr:hypothetical protein [Rubripirellula lacrimiformis]QDT01733.1 hypothetical protein K227x_01000 [Rubripirellula lacrimiformis]
MPSFFGLEGGFLALVPMMGLDEISATSGQTGKPSRATLRMIKAPSGSHTHPSEQKFSYSILMPVKFRRIGSSGIGMVGGGSIAAVETPFQPSNALSRRPYFFQQR